MRCVLRTNAAWLNLLSEAQSDPAILDRFRGLDEMILGIDSETVSAMAAEYLRPERASTAVVIPE